MNLMASSKPFIVGLTGSIGMGKSAVSAMFRRAGVPVFDADAAVRELQGPGGRLVGEIEDLFPGTTGPRGIERQKLGVAVFGKPGELRKLEKLVHPAVAEERRRFLKRNRSRTLLVFDIPLLFETGGDRKVDAIVVVSALAWQQRKRVLARESMTASRFRSIRAIQTPDPVKRRRADFVIATSGQKLQTEAEVRRLVRNLRGRLA